MKNLNPENIQKMLSEINNKRNFKKIEQRYLNSIKHRPMEIKAINTRYKGYNFRSRTEARWAVFFDAMGFTWQYEAEGYHLPCGNYLPDFYFPKHRFFAEVKGKPFTVLEKLKCEQLSGLKYKFDYPDSPSYNYEVLLLDGPPAKRSYPLFHEPGVETWGIFVPVGEKFSPIDYSFDFDDDSYAGTVKAVEKALSYRFEFGGK